MGSNRELFSLVNETMILVIVDIASLVW